MSFNLPELFIVSFQRERKRSTAAVNLLAQIICSGLMTFCICYHAGVSPKHFHRSKVKRRNEKSSPKDASTPKKRKTGNAGKIRIYLWAGP